MKKILLMLAFSGLLLGLAGCDGKGKLEGGGKLSCWEFTVTTKYTGTGSGYLNDTTVKTTQCNLNETQAEAVRKAMESNTTAAGLTVTVTATKKRVD